MSVYNIKVEEASAGVLTVFMVSTCSHQSLINFHKNSKFSL